MHRSLVAAGVVLIWLGGLSCADAPRTLLAPDIPATAKGPPQGFPVVFVREHAGSPSGGLGPIVDSFTEAVDLVRPGGVIRVHRGTYVVNEVFIEKPVTIEAIGGSTPVLIPAEGASLGLNISGIVSGAVRIRGLEFSNFPTGILIAWPYDEVVVEECSFDQGRDAFGVDVLPVPDGASGRINIRGNTFIGGARGLHIQGRVRDVIVAENQFSDHDDGGLGIQIYPSASGVLIGNVLSDCGTWCIGVMGDASGGSGATIQILDNSISIGAGHHTSAAILVLGGDVRIDGNRITGGEKDTATNDPFQRFSLDQGLEILDASAQVTGNAIRKAAVGIATGDSDVSGADNVLDRVHAAFSLFGGSVAINRSDITDYVDPIWLGAAIPSLTCNWWGDVGGPEGAAGIDPSVFTPWATEPIAGTTGNCP